MTDPQQTPTNPLGVRLYLSKSMTRKVGKEKEDWDKVIASIETDKPPGLDAVQALAQLSESLDTFLRNVKLSSQELSTLQPEKPQAPTLAGPAIDLSALDPLWKPNSKGGHWVFSDKAPALKAALLAAPKNTLEIDGRTYKLSGDTQQFVTRWGSKK